MGTTIHVLDPGLAPLLAARLAAETLVTPGRSDAERVALIRPLVPVAAANPTALDTVLAGLLLAALAPLRQERGPVNVTAYYLTKRPYP